MFRKLSCERKPLQSLRVHRSLMISIAGSRADLMTVAPAAMTATAVTAARAPRYSQGVNRCGGGGAETPRRIFTVMKDKAQPDQISSTAPPNVTKNAPAPTKES